MRRYGYFLLIIGMIFLFASCSGKNNTETEKESEKPVNAETVEPSTETSPEVTNEPSEPIAEAKPKQIITYFPSWNLNSKPGAEGGEVASIPWESVTYINHAFFAIEPIDETQETSFTRRAAGKEPRDNFKIISTTPEFDFDDNTPSEVDPSMPRNHFAEYAVYSEKYPDVNIMISIGGWSRSGFFSEMATTKEGRTTFIESCISLMKEYTWIDGIDIDWEYPGGSNDGERLPGDPSDEGCPIWKSPVDDNNNFLSLVKEMREAFDQNFGTGNKKLTACASASVGWTLPNQDWVPIAPYLDYINMMTYDLAGVWDNCTGHASIAIDAVSAFTYLKDKGVDPGKINIGTPYYSTVFVMNGAASGGKIVGAPIMNTSISGDSYTQKELRKFEEEAVSGYTTKIVDGKVVMGEPFDKGGTGWHFAYDESKGAAYMYNDDEKSEYYMYYFSYENPLSLQAKIDAIEKNNISGIIIWESSQDTVDNSMTKQLAEALIN